jgi:hypothetical protein
MTRSESIAKLAAALAKAQGAMRAAAKESINPHFKSRYADLAEVWDACRVPLSVHGLAVVQCPGEIGDKTITLTTMLTHESGEWLENTMTIPVSKPDAQGVGSAITYARRYALAALVGVVQDDDDGNAASKPVQKQYVPRNTAPPDPTSGERPFVLATALAAIQAAPTLDLLKTTYADAYKAADTIGDQQAITALVKAKDDRKEALAKAGPAKLQALTQETDDVPFGDQSEIL